MQADRITANLPAANLDATETFYQHLGFETGHKSGDWMIMTRGPLEIEFFPHPEIDPRTSWFSACVRVNDLDGLYAAFGGAGLSADPRAIPRLTPPVRMPDVPRMFALVDCNGSLIRCLQNEVAA